MKKLLSAVLLAYLVATLSNVSAQSREIIFKNVNVIPMDREVVLRNQTVITRDGVITYVGDAVRQSNEAMVIDGTGKYLMPGLAEMHAHVPPIDDMAPMKDVLALFLVNGITTIRGMLGHPRHLELRTLIQKGEILSPNFYTTGPSFNGMSVTSPEAGAQMVRDQKAAGYDYLKLHPGLTRAKFDSIAHAANQEGIPFAGHVSFGVGVWRAIEAGYSSIDHLDGFIEGMVPGIETMTAQEAGFFGSMVADRADTSQIPMLMRALKENGIWVVPTQSLAERWASPHFTPDHFRNDPDRVYMDSKTVDSWINSKTQMMNHPNFNVETMDHFIDLRRRLIKACQDYGVGLLLGCDAPQVFNVPGFSTHNELVYLVKSGLTPYQALMTGTANVGKYLNRDAGVIRKGAASELVLLNGNPLEDITNTRKIEGVLIGQYWLDRGKIDEMLKDLEKSN